MKEIVKIGKHQREIELECNAATPLVYKRVFGKNLFDEFTKMEELPIDEKLGLIDSIVFISNKMATLPFREALNLKADDYLEFLSNYEIDDLMDVNLINTVTRMWSQDIEVDATPRKPSEADS